MMKQKNKDIRTLINEQTHILYYSTIYSTFLTAATIILAIKTQAYIPFAFFSLIMVGASKLMMDKKIKQLNKGDQE